MKHLLSCRRTFIAFTGVILLGAALFAGNDTSSALATICVGLAGSNAYEKSTKK